MAWTTLLQRLDITLDARRFSWLTTVAIDEAWRLGSTVHEQPAGVLTRPAECNRKPGEGPEPADTDHRGTAEKALDHIEHHDRLQAMQANGRAAAPRRNRREATCTAVWSCSRPLPPSRAEAASRTAGRGLDAHRLANVWRSGRVVGEGHRGSLMSMPVQQR